MCFAPSRLDVGLAIYSRALSKVCRVANCSIFALELRKSRSERCDSRWNLEEIHVTWTQLEKKRMKTQPYKILVKVGFTARGDGIANPSDAINVSRRRCRDPF
ncbi:hypothetical protein Tco_0902020 [Tanacetum coccineum]